MIHDESTADDPAGPLLSSLRLVAGLSQEELAHRSGLSVRTVSDIERGRRPVLKAVSAHLLANALGLGEADRTRFLEAVSSGAPKDRGPASPFGDRLRRLRLAAGLTQQELAERAGISARTVRDIERGHRPVPHPDTANTIAAALGLGKHDLLRLMAQTLPHGVDTPGKWFAAATPGADAEAAILGRDAEIAAIADRYAGGDRLITLAGPGGIGKSRLARAVAAGRELAGLRVVRVPLEAISSAEFVLPAIARAVGVAGRGQRLSVARVAQTLGTTSTLLVLDNFEHLMEAAPSVSTLLQEAPGLAVLVTSREALRVGGERIFAVGPLSLPSADGGPEELAANPAVALFLRGLDGGNPDAPGGEEDAEQAAAIVRRLDGLPLAIELASAKAAAMPLQAVAGLLDAAGLAALAPGKHGHTARFATMDAAIGWSTDLLPQEAQRLFRLLAAFRGGFTGEAVFAVAAERGEAGMVAGLPLLAEAHLIEPDPANPAARMRMLEPVRLFARDRLRDAGEEAAAQRAHARWFLRWARERGREAAGIDPVPALNALDADLANLQAAFANAEPADALVTASALSQYWEVRTRFREGRAILAAAIAANPPEPEGPPPGELMDAMLWSGYLAYLQSDLPGMEEAIAMLRPLAEADGRPEYAARARVLEVLRRDAAGEPPAELAREAREAHALVADGPRETAWFICTVVLGNLLVQNGEVEAALPLLRAYAEWAGERGAAGHREAASYWLGFALLETGDLEEARAQFAESIDWCRYAGYTGTVYMPLMGYILAVGRGAPAGPDLEQAAVLLGALLADADRHGFPFGERYAADIAATREGMARSLGAATLERLVGQGRTLAIGDALDLVQAGAGPEPADS